MTGKNLVEVLQGRRNSDAVGVTFIEGGSQEEFLSYDALYLAALKVLGFLQRRGLRPTQELVFQLDDNRAFVTTFWACILGGIIPVPLIVGQNYDHKKKLFSVWSGLNDPFLIISKPNLGKIEAFALEQGISAAYLEIVSRVIDQDQAFSSADDGQIVDIAEDQIAFVQFSSGSTGVPKGVVVTHANLIANMTAISLAANYSPQDTMMSWMPLSHDMGLIGLHLNPLFCGMNHYLMPTSLFIRRPSLWLAKASEHAVTILCSPNFGYEYLIRHLDKGRAENWDLSRIRIIYNGAEPVSEKLCEIFLDRLLEYGMKRHAMCPVYGLAEASLAVSISRLEDEVKAIVVDRNHLNSGDEVVFPSNENDAISIVNVGNAIPYCSVRITGDDGATLQEGTVGQVLIKGKNVTKGYYNNAAETRKLFTGDGWLRTGDQGFLRDGALYITGRIKDVILLNGQNYYPHDVENIGQEVEGIELNKIAVGGNFNPNSGKEEVIAFIFYRGGVDKFIPIANALKAAVNSRMGFMLDKVIPVKSIPRTTSGKLQRFKLLEEYRAGAFKETELELCAYDLETRHDRAAAQQSLWSDDEKALLTIWQKILGTHPIEITDSFFEIGGNSLKAAELEMTLAREFQVDVPLETLYQKPTISALAGEIRRLIGQARISIPPAPPLDFYPVSAAQRRLYYTWAIDKRGVGYNVPVVFWITGDITPERLEDGLKRLIARHDSLRASFDMALEPQLKIQSQVQFALKNMSCTGDALPEKLHLLVEPFDLSRAPLFRATLLQVEHKGRMLFCDFHHIIADGISVHSLMSELADILQNKMLPELPVQYRDFVYWEERWQKLDKVKTQERYWRQQLHGELPVLDLPLDFKRPAVFSPLGAKLRFEVDNHAVAGLRVLAKRYSCTLHAVFFTLYHILLFKWTGQTDLLIGMPTAGRRHPDLKRVVGMFVNTLAIRVVTDPEATVDATLQANKNIIIDSLKHQDYPFDELVKAIGQEHDPSRNPIFDTMFVYQSMVSTHIGQGDIELSHHFFDPGFSKFDISIEVFEEEESVSFSIEYATTLFRAETVVRLGEHFKHLMDVIVKNPAVRLCDLSILNPDEYHRYTCWPQSIQLPAAKTIHALFEAQAKLKPFNSAIDFRDESVTYSELNNSADTLALALTEKGIGRGSVVAIVLERSPSLITAILAVLKAGACYVPLDIALPDKRIAWIIQDSGSALVITGTTQELRMSAATFSEATIINVDTYQFRRTPSLSWKQEGNPQDLAYIIYTSGTTGEPKGVMIQHHALVNYTCWAASQYIRGNEAAFPLYSSISFDLTVTSIFVPLTTGNKIVIYHEADEQHLLIDRVVADNKSNVIKLTPSHLSLLAGMNSQRPAGIRVINTFIVGGEKLDTRLAKSIYDRFEGQVEIFNEYGPTEATVGCMIHKFSPADEAWSSVPIGVPAANTQIYLLDAFLKPVPTGVHGELYIAGDGLAMGYIHQEVLTAEKFIADPFNGGRMYKTGDIAKRLPDGKLEFLGRKDDQIKINGYRIELPEIENQLAAFAGINEALVVLSKCAESQTELYAYYRSDAEIMERQLKEYLSERLPRYMIPVRCLRVDTFPLTNNGKLDYCALQGLATTLNNTEAVSPANETEALLLKIWNDVLAEKSFKTTDNFFELGGDSIKAVQIASRLLDEGLIVNARDILRYQTVERVSQRIVSHDGISGYKQGIWEGERGLSAIESWFIRQHFVNPHYYNQSIVLTLNKRVDLGILTSAFRKIIEHHDGLRLNYNSEKGVLFYNNDNIDSFVVEEKASTADDQSMVFRVDISPFTDLKNDLDIANRLLIKAAWIRQADGNGLLFVTAHHLIVDGVSWRILTGDLYTVYKALENGEPVRLPAKSASLMDYYGKLNALAGSIGVLAEKTYWEEVEDTHFTIPYDMETSDWRVANMGKVTGVLNDSLTSFLVGQAHRPYKTNVPILLNTALALTLKEWGGGNTFVIEQENHGRHFEDLDTSRTVGWFTALYPVKLELTDGSIGDQIKVIKAQLKRVPSEGIGYGLLTQLGYGIDSGAPTIGAVRLNYLGQFDSEFDNEIFSYAHLAHGSEVDPKNNMTTRLGFDLMVLKGELQVEISYNKRAHHESTVDWLKDTFLENLQSILKHVRDEPELHFTPADFNVKALDQKELDALFF